MQRMERLLSGTFQASPEENIHRVSADWWNHWDGSWVTACRCCIHAGLWMSWPWFVSCLNVGYYNEMVFWCGMESRLQFKKKLFMDYCPPSPVSSSGGGRCISDKSSSSSGNSRAVLNNLSPEMTSGGSPSKYTKMSSSGVLSRISAMESVWINCF